MVYYGAMREVCVSRRKRGYGAVDVSFRAPFHHAVGQKLLSQRAGLGKGILPKHVKWEVFLLNLGLPFLDTFRTELTNFDRAGLVEIQSSVGFY